MDFSLLEDRTFFDNGSDILLTFPRSAKEISDYTHYLRIVNPIQVTATSLDYDICLNTRMPRTVSFNHFVTGPLLSVDYNKEWIKAGIRLAYFYEEWSQYHQNNRYDFRMHEMAGVPISNSVVNPLQDPDFLNINSIPTLMQYIMEFGEQIATTTTSYAFCRQVLSSKGIPIPWNASPQYRKEPDYEVEFRGPVPIKILQPFGGPVYRWSGQDGRAFIMARQAHAICAAHLLPDEKETFKKNSSITDQAEMAWEERRMEERALQYQEHKRTESLNPFPGGQNRKDFQYHSEAEALQINLKTLHDEYAKLPWNTGNPEVVIKPASPTISEPNSDIMPYLIESADAALKTAIKTCIRRDETEIIEISSDEDADEDFTSIPLYHRKRMPGLSERPFREY
jgi:hypothetical protein